MPHAGGTLTIGWSVDGDGHPACWLRPGAAAGGQTAVDLVYIPSHQAAKHTGIIAQSGSGKSFFLGRLVEEILLNTPRQGRHPRPQRRLSELRLLANVAVGKGRLRPNNLDGDAPDRSGTGSWQGRIIVRL